MKHLLIHDTRSVGFLTGAVLTRILRRLGHEVITFFGSDTTRHVIDFWSNTLPSVELEAYGRVVLCCMTFDELHADSCVAQIRKLEEATEAPPLILSHRWPDGYAHTGYDVLVPPIDVLDRYAAQVEPEERELLRLSLIISRQADPQQISDGDFQKSELLFKSIVTEPEKYWIKLTEDLNAVLLESGRHVQSDHTRDMEKLGVLEVEADGYFLFQLASGARGYAEKTIESLLRMQTEHTDVLGLGLLELRDGTRAYIVRPYGNTCPSVQWLLERYAIDKGLPPAESWFGPQDAKSLFLNRVGLGTKDIPRFRQAMIDFAQATWAIRHGGRKPVAGLTRLIHHTADNALASLDILGKHTGENPKISFDTAATQILFDTSNRSGMTRSTLVLKLVIESPESAGFLFTHGGYNLLKLERLLEGALIGMATQRSVWLGAMAVPTRLRIDTHLIDDAMKGLSDAFQGEKEVLSVPLSNALETKLLTEGSCAHKALTQYCGQDSSRMIVFRGSETIGPSVQYAITAAAVASGLAEHKSEPVEVLDLFSGSGITARAILNKRPDLRIWCVDGAIDAKSVGLSNRRDVVWIRTDYRNAVRKEGRALAERFDLVIMDPPHSMLFEMCYAGAEGAPDFFSELSDVAPWLIVYEGHLCQIGRGLALKNSLRKYYERSVTIRVGSEALVVAGPKGWFGAPFDQVVTKAKRVLELDCVDFGLEWSVEEI